MRDRIHVFNSLFCLVGRRSAEHNVFLSQITLHLPMQREEEWKSGKKTCGVTMKFRSRIFSMLEM